MGTSRWHHGIAVLVVAVAAVAVVGVGRLAPLVGLVLLAATLLVWRRHDLRSVAGATAPVGRAVTQAWWAPVAALLGLATVAAGIGTVFEAHNLGGRVVGSTLLVLFGASTLWGLLRRPRHRQVGDVLVLVGTVPAFPLFWLVVPAVAAVVVWVGVLTARPAQATAGELLA